MADTSGLSLISIAVTPKTAADRERLADALQQLTARDATLRVSTDAQSSQATIAATGERHLEIIVDRLSVSSTSRRALAGRRLLTRRR